MNAFFLELLNMSLVASLLIVAVIILRLVFRKAPKAIICVLWALVGLRLVCPFSFESKLSLVPESELVTYISEQSENSDAVKDFEKVTRSVVSYDAPDGSVVVATKESVKFDYAGFLMDALPFVWIGGMALMALSSIISYIRLRRQMLICVKKDDNIWLCDGIKSPFILGIIKPKIYVPSHLNEEEQRLVVAHEQAHIKRLDHLFKPLGFLILTIHWFNPLVWVAYALLCRDIESACDERVVKKMSGEDKKLYSSTLLSCSAPRHMLTACPVAFGEVSVKGRVKSVLSYKKPAFWICIAAVLACAVVAVLFMTNPVKKQTSGFETPEELISQVILNNNENIYTKDNFVAESHYVFGTEELGGNKTTYYLWAACIEYSCENGELTEGLGGVGPKAVTVKEMPDSTFELVEYWEPEDGEDYGDSIKEKFPDYLINRVLYGTSQDCVLDDVKEAAYEHFGIEKPDADVGEYPRFAGEILEVYEDYYLVAPTVGEVIMDQKCEKVYVYHGGEVLFGEGDLVTVSYNKIIEDSLPPILPSVNSISLIVDNFRRPAPASVEFYRAIIESGEAKASAVVDVTQDKLGDIEIFRYSPELSWDEESTFFDGETHIYHERFSPYIYIDNETGVASFVYAEGCYLTGPFTESSDTLTISYYDYAAYINGSGRLELVFERTDEGYVFNKKSSDFTKTYFFEVDGFMCDDLPKDAIFKNDYDLEV